MFDQAESPRTRRLYLALSLTLLLFVGVGLNSLSPSLKLASSGFLSAIVVFWFFGTNNRVPRPGLLIASPLFLLLLFNAISLLWTPMPRPAAELWIGSLLLLLFFLLVLSSRSGGWPARSWLDALLLTIAALSLVELLLVAGWLLEWRATAGEFSPFPPVGYRASGLVLGHPNVMSGIVNLAIPIIVYLFFKSSERLSRIGHAAFLALLLATQYFTSSRTGWISLAASLVVLAVLSWLSGYSQKTSLLGSLQSRFPKLGPLRWAGLIAILGGIGYAGYWQISRTSHAPISRARFSVWEAALDIVQRAPIWGTGFASFPTMFAGLPSSHHEESVPHAHNLALQVIIQSGLTGLILITIFGAILGWFGLIWWRSGSSEERQLLAVFGAIAAGVIVHHLGDYLFGPPIYTMAVLILLGVLIAEQSRSNEMGVGRPIEPWLAGTSAAAVAVLVLLLSGAWAYWEGAQAGRASDWEAATERLCMSYQIEQSEPANAHGCALAREILTLRRQEITLNQEGFAHAATADPRWYIHAANAGIARLEQSDVDGARRFLDQAIRLSPHTAELYLNRGYVEEAAGRMADAAKYYEMAVIEDPWLRRSAFFTTDQTRHNAVASVRLDTHLPPNRAWLWWAEQALRGGQLELADRLLERSLVALPRQPMGYALRAQYYLARGDLEQAERFASAGRFIGPRDPWVNMALIEIASVQGQVALAEDRTLQAARALVNSSDSERYYFAAYARYSLAVDLHPSYIRAIPTELVEGALELLAEQDLSADDRAILVRLIRHSGALSGPEPGFLLGASSGIIELP